MSCSTDTKFLLEPYFYLKNNTGKNIRSQLIEAFDIWLQVPISQLNIIKSVVESLHNASLL